MALTHYWSQPVAQITLTRPEKSLTVIVAILLEARPRSFDILPAPCQVLGVILGLENGSQSKINISHIIALQIE